tara:strand:+ start:7329 stop:7781 length:453 start_codon:yes stop_codon:yes gene_type:complete
VNHKQFKAAMKQGYRSGLEIKIKDFLRENKIPIKYECLKIEWEDLMYRTYTPDFILPNGIIIEVKGRFTASDRRKHVCIKKQHPKLDIRFVFESSRRKLSKGAKSTYATWCERNKFTYCDRVIPMEWLKEKGKNMHPEFIQFPLKKVKRG